MFDKITLVIATKNRHSYLERILDYYTDSGIHIIVADATKEIYKKKLPENISYYHYPEIPYCEKLDSVFKRVNTTYTMLCADDDFIIPQAIATCINFLDTNLDYNSAQGHYVFFNHSKNKLFYLPAYLSTIGCHINDEKATDRIKQYNNIWIQFYYSVHRTETLKDVFSFANNKFFNLNLVELMMGIHTLIKGKHKVLPVFYGVRELLYRSAGKSHGLDVFSTSNEYKEQYMAFFSEVIRLLTIYQGMSEQEAKAFLEQSIQDHIHNRYDNKFSLKKSVLAFGKKIIPFTLRKRLRHYMLLLKDERKQKNNYALSIKTNGFPFKGGPEKIELQRIESYIFKYNIHQ